MRVMQALFGPSREDICREEAWRQLCQEMHADYIKGSFWRSDKVLVRLKKWTIKLDIHLRGGGKTKTPYTRLRAPYVNADGFRFTVYRKSIFTGIGKFLGIQDIEIGDPVFDAAFVIQGNNKEKVIQFFSNPRVRELLQHQPSVNLAVKDDEGWLAQLPLHEVRFC